MSLTVQLEFVKYKLTAKRFGEFETIQLTEHSCKEHNIIHSASANLNIEKDIVVCKNNRSVYRLLIVKVQR